MERFSGEWDEISRQVIHQSARDMQPLFGVIIGNRTAVGEDQSAPPGLRDGGHDLVVDGGLVAMHQWAAFLQPTHQAF